MKNKKSEPDINKKSHFAISLIIPLGFIVIGIIISIAISTTVVEGIAISLLLGIISNQLQQNFTDSSNITKITDNQDILNSNLSDVRFNFDLQNKIENIKHPYFRELFQIRLRAFLMENERLFDGEYYSYDSRKDAFHHSFLPHTHFSLKATVAYWSFPLDKDYFESYLKSQKELIKEKGVKIQRVFIMNADEYDKYVPIMQAYSEIGVDVRYFDRKNTPYVPSTKDEDYLIQDDNIAAYFVGDSGEHTEHSLVTTDPVKVCEKINHFAALLKYAEPYKAK